MGCDEGHVADFVYRTYENIELDAFDISEGVISEAQSQFPYINFFTESVYSYTNEKKYQLGVTSEVLEHLENPEDALKQMVSNIEKNGYILLSVPIGEYLICAD